MFPIHSIRITCGRGRFNRFIFVCRVVTFSKPNLCFCNTMRILFIPNMIYQCLYSLFQFSPRCGIFFPAGQLFEVFYFLIGRSTEFLVQCLHVFLRGVNPARKCILEKDLIAVLDLQIVFIDQRYGCGIVIREVICLFRDSDRYQLFFSICHLAINPNLPDVISNQCLIVIDAALDFQVVIIDHRDLCHIKHLFWIL